MGIEDQLIDSFAGEDDKFGNLFDPERMEELFGSFKELWQDPDKRVEYETLKGQLGEKYMTDPAKYLGFIEESPDMHKDVISAADETGINPEFLYNVVMQEGMSEDMEHSLQSIDTYGSAAPPMYNSARSKDTYFVGMDAFFSEQDLALQREYLKEKIQPVGNVGYATNEAGLKVVLGDISSKDVWRGTGAMLQLNKDYLINSFQKDGVDFNNLSKELQQFWMYSAYNAGAGSANKLFKTYGIDPYSHPEFINELEKQQKAWYSTEFAKQGIELPAKEFPLLHWMENVGRVVGGTELTNLYSPFSGELYR